MRVATAKRPRKRSAYREMLAIDAKDLLRNLQTGFAMLFLFGFYLLVIFAIDFSFNQSHVDPVAVVQSSDAGFVTSAEQALRDRDIEVIESPDGSNVVVNEASGMVVITIAADNPPAWRSTWEAVRSVNIAPEDIEVVDTEGEWRSDILRANLGPALGLGFMAIAFVGTAVPLVSMRERGTLRLLGTTPLRNATLVLSMLPMRYAIGVIEAAVVLLIAITRQYVDLSEIWALAVTMLVGLLMLFPIAFLFAARAKNAATMQQTMAMLAMILVIPAGGILPAQIIPDPVQFVLNALPTSWMIYAMGDQLSGVEPFVPTPVLWVMMLAVAIVAFIVATRIFSWDREDQ